MAEKEMIGFDPLAWMDDADETDSAEKEPKEQVVAEQAVNPVIEPSEPIANEQPAVTERLVAEPIIETEAEAEVQSSNASKLTLDATLNIQNVSHLYEQLLVLLEAQDTIEIDASAVSLIDTATLQLLIVLKQTAIKLHKEIIFDFPSDKFIEAAELLGLAEMLEIDQAAAGFF